MKLMLAAAAALTVAGFGTTAVHADGTLPTPDPRALLQCAGQVPDPNHPIGDCVYCVTWDGVGPVVITFGADAVMPVPYDVENLVVNGGQVCTLDSPIIHP